MNRIARALDALGIRAPKNIHQRLAKITALLVAVSGIWLSAGIADAATLNTASVALSDTEPAVTANYNFTGSGFTASPTKIYCVEETFTVNSDGTGGAPGAPFVTSGTSLDASTTLITPANFTLAAGSPNGTITYAYSTGQVPAVTSGATFNVDGLTNAAAGTYWMKFATYGTGAPAGGVCTGSVIDSTVVGFTVISGSSMTLTVNPTLTFSVAGTASSSTCNVATSNIVTTATTIPFGTPTTSTNSIGCQSVSAATNATGGYTVYVRDTGQLANALAQPFNDFAHTNAAPATFSAAGTENYGYTTDSTSESQFTASGGNKWAGFLNAGDGGTAGNSSLNNVPVATNAGPSSATFNLGFQAGISSTTKPGVYTTTVVYTCTPIF